MIDFEYIARTTAGERVAGVVEADSEAAALRVLDERALFPVRLVGRESSGISRATGRVRLSDLGLVYGQLPAEPAEARAGLALLDLRHAVGGDAVGARLAGAQEDMGAAAHSTTASPRLRR